jgi:hypothetical protein
MNNLWQVNKFVSSKCVNSGGTDKQPRLRRVNFATKRCESFFCSILLNWKGGKEFIKMRIGSPTAIPTKLESRTGKDFHHEAAFPRRFALQNETRGQAAGSV